MDMIDNEERRDRLRERSMDQVSSTWYTYNQHYTAANFYKFMNIGLSSMIAIIGGILSYGLIWDGLPNWLMISLAVGVSVISGIQLVVEPGEKQDKLHNSAQQYHALFDDLVDFLSLDVPSENKDLDELQEAYEKYRKQREELNQEMPDVSSLWYKYIKITKGSEGMREAFSDNIEQELFEI